VTIPTTESQTMGASMLIRSLAVGAMVLVVSFLPQACSPHDVLAVNIPNAIDPGQLNSPAGAVAEYTGAVGDFARANDGDNGGS